MTIRVDTISSSIATKLLGRVRTLELQRRSATLRSAIEPITHCTTGSTDLGFLFVLLKWALNPFMKIFNLGLLYLIVYVPSTIFQ